LRALRITKNRRKTTTKISAKRKTRNEGKKLFKKGGPGGDSSKGKKIQNPRRELPEKRKTSNSKERNYFGFSLTKATKGKKPEGSLRGSVRQALRPWKGSSAIEILQKSTNRKEQNRKSQGGKRIIGKKKNGGRRDL